mmetsp:Transcript_60553/g.131227  ORF Transcript_60553/g.131227 Transcript_60553/m.131227 type:complete len:330 (+) Transcript_60553:74-1063(+)
MADEEPEQPLSEALLDLSNLGRTVDGTGFAYRSAQCMGKRIGVIKAIEAYAHLQHLDLSRNAIKELAPLTGLQYLLELNLSHNVVQSLKAWETEEEPFLPYLAKLDLSFNALKALPALQLKSLRKATFAKNEIATCQDFKGHERLEELDLSSNQIAALEGVAAMPALKLLDLSSNKLAELTGLSELPALEDLNLSQNGKLEALEGPWQDLGSIHSLDLTGCRLASIKTLELLRQLPKLRRLGLRGNPFTKLAESSNRTTPVPVEAEDAGVSDVAPPRVEVLICHWRLEKIDGEDVTPEELEEARMLNVSRVAEERAQAKALEEAAAEAE